jgi:hypothetical protein
VHGARLAHCDEDVQGCHTGLNEAATAMVTDSTQVNTEAGLQAHVAPPRTENDILDGVKIRRGGVHTMRAIENFPITGNAIGQFSEFVQASG